MSAFSEAKDFMRSPQCLLLRHKMYPDPNHEAEFQNDLFLNATCCDNCEVVVDKVDVYYWPNPNGDTSCKKIIGDEVSSAAAGATTDGDGNVYWGCTSFLSQSERFGTESTTIVTTATLTSVASLQFKDYVFNPWQESPCGNISPSLPSNNTQDAAITPRHASLKPRDHSLAATNNVSTAISGTYTL